MTIAQNLTRNIEENSRNIGSDKGAGRITAVFKRFPDAIKSGLVHQKHAVSSVGISLSDLSWIAKRAVELGYPTTFVWEETDSLGDAYIALGLIGEGSESLGGYLLAEELEDLINLNVFALSIEDESDIYLLNPKASPQRVSGRD